MRGVWHLLQLKQIRDSIGYRRVLTAGKQIKERTVSGFRSLRNRNVMLS
jgi:hypothetical protein